MKKSIAELLGVDASEHVPEVTPNVLDIMSDGEAHTIGTIDDYLTFDYGQEASGCRIAASIAQLEEAGHRIECLGPYDGLGCPSRFKLVKEVANA